jgi:ribosomal protein S18 acetylase RimI-like enzyme
VNTAAAATGVTVRRVTPADAAATVALLDALRVSLFGVSSSRLHRALIADGIAQRIDCRLALIASGLGGVVLAAPRAYWSSALLNHPDVAFECLRARLIAGTHGDSSAEASAQVVDRRPIEVDAGAPRRTWADPGDAWRIIFVGTAPAARGRGVAADLYKAVMRDRSLVARIAADNHASIRLHRSVGWRLYRDGEVVLAVHERRASAT